MRMLRWSLLGTVILALLATQTAAVIGQSEAEESAKPVHFTAVISRTGGGQGQDGFEFDEGHTRIVGRWWHVAVRESSDPRFAGTGTWRGTTDTHSGNPSLGIHRGAWRLENDDGAWQQVPTTSLNLRNTADFMPFTVVFDGEGAYTGLTAAALATIDPEDQVFWTLDGVIFDGEVPPMPDPVEPPAE